MLIFNGYCCECLHSFSLIVDVKCRKTTCPYCNTINDFWLDSEQPPENHKEALTPFRRHLSPNNLFQPEKHMTTTAFDGTKLFAGPVPAPHHGATHCDDCGLTWLDDGLNPLGCPYCKNHASERNARRYLALRKVGVHVPGYELVKFDWGLDAAADRLLEECSSQAQNGVGNEQH